MQTINKYPFLGADVGNGLYFTEHVKKVEGKGRKRVNIMKCMAWKDWGNSPEVQRTLYLQSA